MKINAVAHEKIKHTPCDVSPIAAGAAGRANSGGSGTPRGLLFLQGEDAGLDGVFENELGHLRQKQTSNMGRIFRAGADAMSDPLPRKTFRLKFLRAL